MKSKRQRKRDRAKRQAASAQRAAAARQRQLVEETYRKAERRVELLYDPSTPIDQIAGLIQEVYGTEPVMPGLAARLHDKRGSVDDVLAVAEAMRAEDASHGEQPSLPALTFGAHAAHLAKDYAQSRRLMDQALQRAIEPELLLRLATHLGQLGRTADALDIIADHVSQDAYFVAPTAHGLLVEDARRHLSGEEPVDECQCGSGMSWAECCRKREADAVERFLDRFGLYELRTAIVDFLPGSAYDVPVAERVADWLADADATSWGAAEQEPLERLAYEHAWLTATRDEDGDDDRDNVLTALAEDPATAPEIAGAAEVWQDHIRYGLWQVSDPSPGPGLWCTDVVSGQELYVAFAPEQTELLARWAVLAGAVVPLGGAWRATGSLIQVTPTEADAMTETIHAAAEVIVAEVAGRRPNKQALQRMRDPVPFGRAEPHNVYAYAEEAPPPEAAAFVGKIVGSLLPRLLAELRAWRATPPTLTNTDGEPMTMITARIALGNAAAVIERLAAHVDFEADPEDPGRWNWLGREVPEAQRATMLAEFGAQLAMQGGTEFPLEPAGPNRWVRGQLELHGDKLTARVNSQERLDRLLTILDRLGAGPSLVEQSRVDPAQDLPWSAGHWPFPGGLAPPAEGFERQWLDERVPALHGRTPRQAALGDEEPLLEGLPAIRVRRRRPRPAGPARHRHGLAPRRAGHAGGSVPVRSAKPQPVDGHRRPYRHNVAFYRFPGDTTRRCTS